MNVCYYFHVARIMGVIVPLMLHLSCYHSENNGQRALDIHALCSDYSSKILQMEQESENVRSISLEQGNVLVQGPYRADRYFWPRYFQYYSARNENEKGRAFVKIYSAPQNEMIQRKDELNHLINEANLEFEFSGITGTKFDGWNKIYLSEVTYFDTFEDDVDYYFMIQSDINGISIGLNCSGPTLENVWMYDSYQWINLSRDKGIHGALMLRLIVEHEEPVAGDYECIADFL